MTMRCSTVLSLLRMAQRRLAAADGGRVEQHAGLIADRDVHGTAELEAGCSEAAQHDSERAGGDGYARRRIVERPLVGIVRFGSQADLDGYLLEVSPLRFRASASRTDGSSFLLLMLKFGKIR